MFGSASLLRHGFELARELGVGTLMIQAASEVSSEIEPFRASETVIWLAPEGRGFAPKRDDDPVVEIPELPLTRVSQIKLGILFALAKSYVRATEPVICISGIHGKGLLDTIVLIDPRLDFPWFRAEKIASIPKQIPLEIVLRALQIAVRFAAEGREGKPIGTILVIGDPVALGPHVRQLILNPLAGHPAHARNLAQPAFSETLRELVALDGAVILDLKGQAVSAGTYLDSPHGKRGQKRPVLLGGLGARHHAASGITATTPCVAIVISESSRAVRLFVQGALVLEIERGEYGAGPVPL